MIHVQAELTIYAGIKHITVKTNIDQKYDKRLPLFHTFGIKIVENVYS